MQNGTERNGSKSGFLKRNFSLCGMVKRINREKFWQREDMVHFFVGVKSSNQNVFIITVSNYCSYVLNSRISYA